jgi:hypothetical protein
MDVAKQFWLVFNGLHFLKSNVLQTEFSGTPKWKDNFRSDEIEVLFLCSTYMCRIKLFQEKQEASPKVYTICQPWYIHTYTDSPCIAAGWPDWAYFRPIGDCFLSAITKVAIIFGLLFYGWGYALRVTKINWQNFVRCFFKHVFGHPACSFSQATLKIEYSLCMVTSCMFDWCWK